MWTRTYGALGQTSRVCFGVGQVRLDVDKELWRLRPDGSGEKKRTEGDGKGERETRVGDGKRESGRERAKPALNGEKGLVRNWSEKDDEHRWR
ncbi:hypothetical protein TNCV_4957681 [Trichonephila clavipes]|nr:hypothetical protein TNCV_4957681 [Trichonephila clavipes]